MASVVGLSARYANFLVHPLPVGPGVCWVCRGPVPPHYTVCYQCHTAEAALGNRTADAVVPISLALKREQFANELWRYKNTTGAQQDYFRMGLAAVLWRFLEAHEACVAASCGVSGFPIVTTVPSTSGRADHPLRTLVAETVGETRDRFRDLLSASPIAGLLGRAASAQRFTSSPLSREPVLLIDDTWTTGGHMQSAVAALKASGAGQVAAVVLGRHLNTSYGDTATLVDRARLRSFSWETCCVHRA